MSPLRSESLTRLAIETLEDALALANIGTVERSWGIRLALAWLRHGGIAESWQAASFWECLATERDRADFEQNVRYLTLTSLSGMLDTWRHRAGLALPLGDWSRHHRVRRIAPDLDPRNGTAHLSCMCNRYIPGDRQRVLDHFSAKTARVFNEGPSIVHPREPGWVIRLDGADHVLDQMTWGFPVYVSGRIGKRGQMLKPKPVNNARFDKLGTFWKRWAINPRNRCLIPAVRYAEAVGSPGSMTCTWLSLKSTPVFAWAGLWTESEEWGAVYTGVMTDNAPELVAIHDRSPVILAHEDWHTWLTAPLQDLPRFDRPWPASDTVIEPTQALWKDAGSPATL